MGEIALSGTRGIHVRDIRWQLSFFFDNCPEDLREKVEKEWPAYKKEILEKQAQGIYDSRDWF